MWGEVRSRAKGMKSKWRRVVAMEEDRVNVATKASTFQRLSPVTSSGHPAPTSGAAPLGFRGPDGRSLAFHMLITHEGYVCFP